MLALLRNVAHVPVWVNVWIVARYLNSISKKPWWKMVLKPEFTSCNCFTVNSLTPLNVVILIKTNLETKAWAHVILFSSDLELAYDKLIDYYSLRFQIEFNFRDAKQFWGLEDFMNVTQTAVTNAANLSLFLVDVSQVLMCKYRKDDPNFSVLDLKAYYRGYRYVTETIKILPQITR